MLLAAADGDAVPKLARSVMQAMFPFMPDDSEVKRVAIERLNRFISSGAAYRINHDIPDEG